MMEHRLLLLILLLLLGAVQSNSEVACSTGEAASIRFSVTSRRNETRHRIVSVNLHYEANASTEASGEMALDVTHSRSVCGGREQLPQKSLPSVGLDPITTTYPKPRPRTADYELFPDLGYYKLHTTGKIWEDARVSCISEQAHLIIINSDAEAGVVKKFFSRKPNLKGVTKSAFLFVGIHDKFTEGQFVSVAGEPLASTGYALWDYGEPDGSTDKNFGGVGTNGRLHDIPNHWKLAFVCEQEL